MRFIVLGQNGFIGSRMYNFFSESGAAVKGFKKSELNFCQPTTFSNYSVIAGDIIVDCIARIDGSEEEINAVNLAGLTAFLEYINRVGVQYKYLYFSTYAVCMDELIHSNNYVRSKYLAEGIIREKVTSYKIIRLIFPFGKGENKNRLISRIINKVKSGETVVTDKLTLNLTTFADLEEHFNNMVGSSDKEINFSNGIEIYLPVLVEFIFDQLGLEKKFTITCKEMKIVAPVPFPASFSKETIYKEVLSMLHD